MFKTTYFEGDRVRGTIPSSHVWSSVSLSTVNPPSNRKKDDPSGDYLLRKGFTVSLTNSGLPRYGE